jgi:hypothetical protein
MSSMGQRVARRARAYRLPNASTRLARRESSLELHSLGVLSYLVRIGGHHGGDHI